MGAHAKYFQNISSMPPGPRTMNKSVSASQTPDPALSEDSVRALYFVMGIKWLCRFLSYPEFPHTRRRVL